MDAQETDQGLIVSVSVKPNSPGFRLYKKGGRLFLDSTRPPREGRVNGEIVRELPRLLRCGVRIVSGLKSRRKLLLLTGIEREDLEAFLE